MNKTPLVVFGEDWCGHPSSTQHLMRRLAETRKILWVNSIGLRRPRFNHRDLSRLVAKSKAMMFQHPKADDVVASPTPRNIEVVDPLAISWPGGPGVSQINRRLFAATISPLTANLGERPILWCSLPTAVDAIGAFPAAGVVYYAGDDFSALEGVDHRPVSRMEQRLCRRADVSLAASAALKSRLSMLGAPYVSLLEHGCDVDLFSAPTPPSSQLPSNRPVAGYYGAIAEWLDFDLIIDAARCARNWLFLFVGPVKTNIERLLREPNIRIHAPVAHSVLPSFAQHWTTSILPFRDTPQIRSCNSLKLREYLAAGRPIIATEATPLQGFERHVRRIANRSAFLDAMFEAQSETGVETVVERRAAVADHSWRARAKTLVSLLDDVFAPSLSSRAA